MGVNPSHAVKQDIENLPILEEEPDYVIKTRPPLPSTWKLNILRGKVEGELTNEAMSLARRKCYKKVKAFEQCEKENGQYKTAFNCQQQNKAMLSCFDHEYQVEMDKLRRDINRNNQWYWRDLYDEDGEIGEQAAWKDEWWITLRFKKFYKSMLSNNNNSVGENPQNQPNKENGDQNTKLK